MTTIPIINASGEVVHCEFLVQERGFTLLWVRAMRESGVTISLLMDKAEFQSIAKNILLCENASGGMKIPPVKLEVQGDPIFMKRRILPYGIRDAVYHDLSKMVNEGIKIPVSSSRWAIAIVPPMKKES